MHWAALCFAMVLGLALLALKAGADEGSETAPKPVPSLAEQKPNTWVKRSPLPGGPPSPRKGYESSIDYDPYTKQVIRHGGHNQGGGGAQYFEVWLYDPVTGKWELRQPNTSPPGVCCERDNVFNIAARRFVRFPAHSNSHGWQWTRMIYLRNYTAWTYDPVKDTWRNMRPVPWVQCSPGRGAVYDTHNDVIVVFAGEGNREGTAVYDLYTNTWTRMNPPQEPPYRCYTGMAYDQARRKIVLFGSHYKEDPRTWVYDIKTNQWADMKPATHPPADKTAPVMAYDSANKVMVAVLRSGAEDGRLQTWVYDLSENTWTKMNAKGDLGSSGPRNRLMVYLPDHNIVWFENRTREEQQVWTYRYACLEKTDAEPPAKPDGLKVIVSSKGEAKLSWRPGPGQRPAGYRLYSGSAEVPWKAEYKRVGPELIKRTKFTHEGLERGKIYFYRVSAVGKNGKESDESMPARTQPRALDHAVVSVLNEREVALRWGRPTGAGLLRYFVERADVEVYTTAQEKGMLAREDPPAAEPPVGMIKKIGQFRRLNREPLRKTKYLDSTVELRARDRKVPDPPLYYNRPWGKPLEERPERYNPEGKRYRFAVYAYRIKSVNALGVESGPSPFFLTIPSAVEGVFAKEDDDAVHLKWKSNPEKQLRGYLVYRMNERFNPKIPLLTKEAIKGTSYTDKTAGRHTRRYFIVAVDALGQEGIPSSPVWSYREWRRFYRPFGVDIGTWHQ